jgi:hypothetical protein
LLAIGCGALQSTLIYVKPSPRHAWWGVQVCALREQVESKRCQICCRAPLTFAHAPLDLDQDLRAAVATIVRT